ncbi:nuclear transcription factor Y subunit B-3-like [Impatiens glandulifera]|uniref:nuclear transcription factor Y subunit B-3-like n=1 Tax=Impatiens glandulifera TaxID=253017 RepID=UPI001FB0CB5C|nr:nuclear transcription factor Y subunit B-3-like [Impatiens glandulifera]
MDDETGIIIGPNVVGSRAIPIETTNSKNINNNNNENNSSIYTINKEQDRFLPIANVGRIMKKVIPGNGKISKDAKETVQECVSEFISFVTGEASDKCQREKRKTINGDDIIWALTTLGFENYLTPLKHYLVKYRELEGEKLHVPKQQRTDQQRGIQLHDEQQSQQQHVSYNGGMYPQTTSGYVSQSSSFMGTEQTFPMSYPSSSVQQQILHHPPDQDVDSLGHW